MPFHSHTLENGLQIIGETNAVGSISRAGLLRSHGGARRNPRRFRRHPLPGAHGFQGDAAALGTGRQSGLRPHRRPLQRLHQRRKHRLLRRHPAGVHAPGGRHPCRHPPSQPCGSRTSTWRRTSSSKKSACTKTSRCGRRTIMPSASTSRDHPLGNSILGTPDSIRALTRDQMHSLLRSPLRRPEHHRGGGRQLRLAQVRGLGRVALRRLATGPGGPAGQSARHPAPAPSRC